MTKGLPSGECLTEPEQGDGPGPRCHQGAVREAMETIRSQVNRPQRYSP